MANQVQSCDRPKRTSLAVIWCHPAIIKDAEYDAGVQKTRVARDRAGFVMFPRGDSGENRTAKGTRGLRWMGVGLCSGANRLGAG